MKKNRMLRLASALLVSVLLTTSVISGTFAKYVTTADAEDSARVAKWGVTIDVKNSDTFKTEYDKDDSSYTITGGKSVKMGSGTGKVIAPGTSGEMVKMTLSGTPEVAVRVNYTGEFDINDKWSVDNDGDGTAETFYCPLIITISKGSTQDVIDGSTKTSKTDFVNAVNDAIKDAKYQAVYAPGTNLSQKGGDSLNIKWEWPFSPNSGVNDVKDTYLGDQAANGEAATVTVKFTTTVTQID